MTEYTESVFIQLETRSMCRILENILMHVDGELMEGISTVDTDGVKIVYGKDYFDAKFTLFNAGKTPAEVILEGTDGND